MFKTQARLEAVLLGDQLNVLRRRLRLEVGVVRGTGLGDDAQSQRRAASIIATVESNIRYRRMTGSAEAHDDIVDVLELRVAVGMLASLAGLGVALQAETEVRLQTADQVGADPISLGSQRGGQMSLAAAHPKQDRLWVATRCRGHQLQQRLAQARLCDRRRLAADRLITTSSEHCLRSLDRRLSGSPCLCRRSR